MKLNKEDYKQAFKKAVTFWLKANIDKSESEIVILYNTDEVKQQLTDSANRLM